jgi:hypothetical protein
MGQIGNFILYAVVGCAAGIIFGIFIYYLQYRFVVKNRIPLTGILYLFFSRKPRLDHSNKSKTPPVAQNKAPDAIDQPGVPASIIEKQPEPAAVLSEPARPVPVIDKLLVDTMSRLRTEFEQNYIIVKDFSGDNLLPLHTDVWDSHQQTLGSLPGKLRDDLDKIYYTIKVLNQLVWFSTEFQRCTPGLRERYVSLLAVIAEGLKEISRNLYSQSMST